MAGRPEWVFVKLHTHAMQNRASFLGAGTEATFAAMEHWWNRPPFRLHYVTVREAYNIVKAAEAGHEGDPNDFRDFAVPMPANRLCHCTGDWLLKSWTPQRTHLQVLEPGSVRLEFSKGSLRSLNGRLREVTACYRRGELESLQVHSAGPVAVDPPRYAEMLRPLVTA